MNSAYEDLLATVDHILKQLDMRDGQLALDQIEMLRMSADKVHEIRILEKLVEMHELEAFLGGPSQ
jgi:hypothetical protein